VRGWQARIEPIFFQRSPAQLPKAYSDRSEQFSSRICSLNAVHDLIVALSSALFDFSRTMSPPRRYTSDENEKRRTTTKAKSPIAYGHSSTLVVIVFWRNATVQVAFERDSRIRRSHEQQVLRFAQHDKLLEFSTNG